MTPSAVTVDDHVVALLERCAEAGQWATINHPSDEQADALTADDAGRYRVFRRPVGPLTVGTRPGDPALTHLSGEALIGMVPGSASRIMRCRRRRATARTASPERAR